VLSTHVYVQVATVYHSNLAFIYHSTSNFANHLLLQLAYRHKLYYRLYMIVISIFANLISNITLSSVT